MKKIAFALLAVALASPAVAGNKGEASAAPPKKPHKICKHDETVTGSHLSPIVCKTAAEWDALNQQGAGMLGVLMHGPVGAPEKPMGQQRP